MPCYRRVACPQDGERMNTDGAKEGGKQHEVRAERFGTHFLQAFVHGHRRTLTNPYKVLSRIMTTGLTIAVRAIPLAKLAITREDIRVLIRKEWEVERRVRSVICVKLRMTC